MGFTLFLNPNISKHRKIKFLFRYLYVFDSFKYLPVLFRVPSKKVFLTVWKYSKFDLNLALTISVSKP